MWVVSRRSSKLWWSMLEARKRILEMAWQASLRKPSFSLRMPAVRRLLLLPSVQMMGKRKKKRRRRRERRERRKKKRWKRWKKWKRWRISQRRKRRRDNLSLACQNNPLPRVAPSKRNRHSIQVHLKRTNPREEKQRVPQRSKRKLNSIRKLMPNSLTPCQFGSKDRPGQFFWAYLFWSSWQWDWREVWSKALPTECSTGTTCLWLRES